MIASRKSFRTNLYSTVFTPTIVFITLPGDVISVKNESFVLLIFDILAVYTELRSVHLAKLDITEQSFRRVLVCYFSNLYSTIYGLFRFSLAYRQGNPLTNPNKHSILLQDLIAIPHEIRSLREAKHGRHVQRVRRVR